MEDKLKCQNCKHWFSTSSETGICTIWLGHKSATGKIEIVLKPEVFENPDTYCENFAIDDVFTHKDYFCASFKDLT